MSILYDCPLQDVYARANKRIVNESAKSCNQTEKTHISVVDYIVKHSSNNWVRVLWPKITYVAAQEGPLR